MKLLVMILVILSSQVVQSADQLMIQVTGEQYLSFDYLPKCMGAPKKVLEKALLRAQEDCGNYKGEVKDIISQSVNCSPSIDGYCECQAKVQVNCQVLH